MELAIAVYKIESLSNIDDKYTRIYYGREFCSNMLVSIDEIKSVVTYCDLNNKNLTIVTPFLTVTAMKYMIQLLNYLDQNKIECELVINDWGLLYYINQYFKNRFKLIIGPLLNKMKKSPVVSNIIDKVGIEAADVLKTSSCDLLPTCNLLKLYGVERIEYENPLQGVNLTTDENVSKTLRYPYVFITIARRCSTDLVVNNLSNYNLEQCNRSCNNTYFKLYNKVIGRDLVLKGNTYYYKNEMLPTYLDKFTRFVSNHDLIDC